MQFVCNNLTWKGISTIFASKSMKNYLEIIESALKERFGITDLEELEFRELPYGGKESYNTDKVIGNKNLSAGRFKTREEADKEIEAYLELELP